jgi:hypothetical protein
VTFNEKEHFGTLSFQKAVGVFREDDGISDQFVRRQTHEQPEREVVFQQVHEHPFAVHRIVRLQ